MKPNKSNTHTMIALICVLLSIFTGFWAGLVSWALVVTVFELMLLTPNSPPNPHLNKE